MRTNPELTADEKQTLYEDGFIVLKDVVPDELTFEARRTIHMFAGRNGLRRGYHDIQTSSALPDLVNKSILGQILRTTIGPYDPPERGFAAILYPNEKQPTPNYGWHPHLDGLWSGPLPKTADEIDDLHSPRTEHFGAADATVSGANLTPLFQDPECTLSLGSFTAFVGVALNDQTEFGRGNLCLLRGVHEDVEAFFQMQRDSGGVVGPEGEGWPRLSRLPNGGVSMTPLPYPIREIALKHATEYNGNQFINPAPILLDVGDVVIALHACPHGGSRNEWSDPRMNVYFRIRRDRPGGARVLGDSDHPDREWLGGFYDYPGGYNPWQVAIDKLCDHWSEWDGMQETVAANRARSAATSA
ncbi:MAG: hypothetical protein F4W90_08260 [Gammaproteobacteria bacterium]|nr:hypothetical protein [Gammaproteobacteria bacterium]